MNIKNHYQCDFCKKTFAKQKTFTNHQCKLKKRFVLKNEKFSILAFWAFEIFFQKIFPNQKKDFLAFIKSKYYNSFTKWSQFVIENSITISNQYLEYLIENQISINKWHKDYVFEEFVFQFLKKEPFENGIERSIEFIAKWAEQNHCKMNEFFHKEHGNKIILYFKLGKLSPWILFTSDLAKNWFENLNQEQQTILENFIDTQIWNRKIAIYKKQIFEFNKILKRFCL